VVLEPSCGRQWLVCQQAGGWQPGGTVGRWPGGLAGQRSGGPAGCQAGGSLAGQGPVVWWPGGPADSGSLGVAAPSVYHGMEKTSIG
jgi:hypothetical protein